MVEAQSLPTNNAQVVVKFLKKLISRFGSSREIISDRTHFCSTQFEKVMKKYGVNHHMAIAYHSQMSVQVEVTNHELTRILEKIVHHNRQDWFERLDDALWAYRTTFKTPTGYTFYLLVYSKACHLPVELEHQAYWDTKFLNFDIIDVGWKF